jgi:hypothetical protein
LGREHLYDFFQHIFDVGAKLRGNAGRVVSGYADDVLYFRLVIAMSALARSILLMTGRISRSLSTAI